MILSLRVAAVSAVSLRFLRIVHMAEDVRFCVAVRRSASRPGPLARAFLYGSPQDVEDQRPS